ncbi:hypothetical protein AQI95_40755 [Streptomyces yokosukanensis]|uniref:Uncharacterized protein n=1 Tax=Streptomyces yokosukanensis TaxID=67386 RepID=A0A101NTY8_9ACTN|nr:hypothetical protein AQI95_40755 [Streptomyces yokosukanensis]
MVLLLSRAVCEGGRGVPEVEFPQDGDDGMDVVGGGRDRVVAVGRQRESGTGGPAGRLRRSEFVGGHSSVS